MMVPAQTPNDMNSISFSDGPPPKKWSRLREVRQDSLEAFGLPSKGDGRFDRPTIYFCMGFAEAKQGC